MVRKEHVLGSPGAGSDEPAPWEAEAQPEPLPPRTLTEEAAPTVTGEDVDQAATDMERDLGMVVRAAQQGVVLSKEEALERLNRARQASTPAVTMGPAVQRLGTDLLEFAKTVDNQSTGVFEDIATRIEKAETADDVLADDSPLDAEEVIGVPLQIWDVTINESDFKDGLPAYVALRAVRLDTHEDVVITCGAFKVVAKAFKLRRIKAFPVQAMIKQSDRKTSNGYDVLDLVKPPAGAPF